MSYYDLEEVRQLAKQGKVRYIGWRVQQDIHNLEYEFSDVLSCLINLTTDEFWQTKDYDGDKQDVYHTTHRGESNEEDPLYVKLKIDEEGIELELRSFHRPR